MPTIDSRVSTVEAILKRLDGDINGNGKPGLRDEFTAFKAQAIGILKFIAWFAGFTVLLLTLIVAYLAYRWSTQPHASIIGQGSVTSATTAGDSSIPSQ
jgi:hypothetical protein